MNFLSVIYLESYIEFIIILIICLDILKIMMLLIPV